MNDPIDRQKAIEMLEKGIREYGDEYGISDAICDLDDMPSAEPISQIKWERDTAIAQLKELGYGFGEKPKKGNWISEGQKNKGINFWMHCSLCGYKTIDAPSSRTNYCPNCGARMED